jgi:isoleucyl-tRNA synthetase
VAQAFDLAGVASETLAEGVVLASRTERLIERGESRTPEFENVVAAKTYANVGPVTVAVARIGAPA